jgi:hypothetical protein
VWLETTIQPPDMHSSSKPFETRPVDACLSCEISTPAQFSQALQSAFTSAGLMFQVHSLRVDVREDLWFPAGNIVRGCTP